MGKVQKAIYPLGQHSVWCRESGVSCLFDSFLSYLPGIVGTALRRFILHVC